MTIIQSHYQERANFSTVNGNTLFLWTEKNEKTISAVKSTI